MNTPSTSSIKRREDGFTLVEILIAIVVVGVLAAVAIIGINSLTKTGSDSACKSSADAANAAAAAYFAANSNTWPTSIAQMVTGGQYVTPSGANVSGTTMTVGSWTLTMTGASGTAGPRFTCS